MTYNTPTHHQSPTSYSYRSGASASAGDTTPTTTVSSTEPDFGSNIVSSNHSAINVIHSTAGGTLHQRRGSLQLWQFLVALLDEPAAR